MTTLTLSSSIRLIRREKDLLRVSGLTSAIDNAPTLAAPLLGAGLMPVVGASTLYAADAVSYAIAFLVVFGTGWGADLTSQAPGARPAIRAGFAFVFTEPGLARVQMLYLALNVSNGIAASVVVAGVLTSAAAAGGDPRWWLAATQVLGAVGAVAAGLWVGARGTRYRRAHLFVGGLLLAAVLGRIAPWASATLIVWCVAMFTRNVGLQINGAALSALWQERTPDHLQAAVAGARKILGQGFYPPAVALGGVIAAALSQAWGVDAGQRAVLGFAGVAELVTLALFLSTAAARATLATPE